MEWVDDTTKIPIKSWCRDVEPNAYEQARHAANLPFAFRHIALMPDCHVGYSLPIGGVFATRKAILPAFVGVDIACGMIAVKTDCVRRIRKETVKKIFSKLREVVPVGFNHHAEDQEWDGFDNAPDIQVIQQQLNPARKQLGTLGGGKIRLLPAQEDNLNILKSSLIDLECQLLADKGEPERDAERLSEKTSEEEATVRAVVYATVKATEIDRNDLSGFVNMQQN